MKRSESRHAGTIAMLERIHWSHIVGINLPHCCKGDRMAEKTGKEFLNRLSRMLRVKPKRMLWVLAFEQGTSGRNPHLHALIGGPSRALSKEVILTACDAIARDMELPRIIAGRYEKRPNAISYLFKERESPLDDGRWPMHSPNLSETLRRGRM
jgi:hypothetical protein